MLRTPLCTVSLIALALAGGRPSCAAEASSAPLTPSLSVENGKMPLGVGPNKGQANAVVDRDANSAATIPASTNETAAAKPTFSLAAGTYASAQSVSLTDATAGFVIHYTTNGNAPTAASAVYKAPIRVASTETIKAITAPPVMRTAPWRRPRTTLPPPGSSQHRQALRFPLQTLAQRGPRKSSLSRTPEARP
jgi:hypothetical protein